MKWIKAVLLLLVVSTQLNAQQPAFWKEIQDFKKKDSVNMPAKKQILFVGSSSFTFWTDVQDYFPGKPIINRGFGGSTLADLIRYKDDVITKYDPKQIVMYCGENDFASSDTVTVPTVVGRFKSLFDYIQKKFPNIPFAYVSMKPSPSRTHLMGKYSEANKQIADYLKKFKNTVFVDAYSAMLQPDGQPMPEIFKEDRLHMNAKGYAIWKKLLEPILK